MSSLAQRIEIIGLVDQAVLGGARYECACEVIGIASSTLRRWRDWTRDNTMTLNPEKKEESVA